MREFFPDGAANSITTSDIRDYLQSPDLRIAYFVLLQLSVSPYYKGYCTLPYDYNVYDPSSSVGIYEGAGELLQISEIEETSNLESTGVKVTLAGVESTAADLFARSTWFREKISIYLGLFGDTFPDGSSRAFYNDNFLSRYPINIFEGRMDTVTLEDSGGSATVTVTAESVLADFERANPQRFTFNNHVLRGTRTAPLVQGSPTIDGDTAFKHVTEMQKKVIKWGT